MSDSIRISSNPFALRRTSDTVSGGCVGGTSECANTPATTDEFVASSCRVPTPTSNFHFGNGPGAAEGTIGMKGGEPFLVVSAPDDGTLVARMLPDPNFPEAAEKLAALSGCEQVRVEGFFGHDGSTPTIDVDKITETAQPAQKPSMKVIDYTEVP
ncbi:MAG: hypothetical protein ACT4TC_08100 [Myxococcaceae bacterium]